MSESKDLHLWRSDQELCRAVLVHCPDGEYPAKDADGHSIYENTHFKNEDDAWDCLIQNADARVNLAGHFVIRAEKALHDAQVESAEAVKTKVLTNKNLARRRSAKEKENQPPERGNDND